MIFASRAREREPMRIAPLQPESTELQPLLEEIQSILPGNDLERKNSLLQLRENMRSGQGLILQQGKRPLAVLLYYLKGSSCRIVFTYALKQYDPARLLTYLLEGLLELARADQSVNSVRFDMVPWFPDSVRQAFVACRFEKADRMLMHRQGGYPKTEVALPSGMTLVAWDTWLTKPASEMLYYIFSGGYEGKWDRGLTEISGCRQFLSDCYSGRFGIFDPAVSFALQYQNLWVGLAIASWSGEGEGFIPSFGLMPNFVGQGLGHKMMELLLYRFGQCTFPPVAIELAVSEANKAAAQLYLKYDFRVKNRFQVYYLNIR